MSELSGNPLTISQAPPGYDSEIIEDIGFTQAEIDMIYFACLHYMGHPQAQAYEMQDSGFDSLLTGLQKIQTRMEEIESADEGPQVISAE